MNLRTGRFPFIKEELRNYDSVPVATKESVSLLSPLFGGRSDNSIYFNQYSNGSIFNLIKKDINQRMNDVFDPISIVVVTWYDPENLKVCIVC